MGDHPLAAELVIGSTGTGLSITAPVDLFRSPGLSMTARSLSSSLRYKTCNRRSRRSGEASYFFLDQEPSRECTKGPLLANSALRVVAWAIRS